MEVTSTQYPDTEDVDDEPNGMFPIEDENLLLILYSELG